MARFALFADTPPQPVNVINIENLMRTVEAFLLGLSAAPANRIKAGALVRCRLRFTRQRIGSVPHRLRSRPPSAIAITTRISSGRGASATDVVIVSK